METEQWFFHLAGQGKQGFLTSNSNLLVQDLIPLPSHPKVLMETTVSAKRIKYTIFVCPMCDYTVDRVESYRRHMRLHTGDMFRCDKCNKQYTTQNGLHKHKESKHGFGSH